MPIHLTPRHRIAAFVVLAAVTSAMALFVVRGTKQSASSRIPKLGESPNTILYDAPTAANLNRLLALPHFLSVHYPAVPGEAYRLEVVPAGDPRKPRVRTKLSCLIVHFRSERGICIPPPVDPLGTQVQFIDKQLDVTRTFTLAGTPSRARMSPDGNYAAVTNFLSGHSYSDASFSTATTLIDTATGKSSNLEEWSVFNESTRIVDQARNFWGVTFLSDNSFYVAMGVRGDRFLLKGELKDRTLRVLGPRMECPSVAPDGRHLTFRRGVVEASGATSMPLFLLDLETMTERRLTFDETVDGQPEWIDNRRLSIGTPTGPPNVAIIDIENLQTGPAPWKILIPDSTAVAFVNPVGQPVP